MNRFPSKAWVDRNVEWQRSAINQIRQWTKEEGINFDKTTEAVVRRRWLRLDNFLKFFFEEDYKKYPVLFDANDAAAMIILPKYKAVKIARSLFHSGPGIAGNLQAEDITWNMDWFSPSSYP